MSLRIFAWVALVVFLAVGGGWVWGASGKSVVELARRDALHRAEMSEARAHILRGQVTLYLVNFGEASREFELARGVIEVVQTRLRESGDAERAGRLEIALTHLKDAQRLAIGLDQSAQVAADAALKALQSIES